VLALNTWARPEAILGLNLRSQIDHEAGIVHLNPDGRRQTKKHRPAIRLTRNLALWLDSKEWKDLTYAVHRKSVPLTTIKKVFKAHALKLGMPGFTPYTLRHFMATNVRRVEGVEVSREQRQEWLGHKRQDTTSWYEHHDPEWLREAAEATDAVVERLDGMLAVRSLFPSSSQAALKSSNKGQPRLRLVSTK
jgi:integrase